MGSLPMLEQLSHYPMARITQELGALGAKKAEAEIVSAETRSIPRGSDKTHLGSNTSLA